MQARNPKRQSARAMTNAYIELVKQIPEVQLVVLVKDDPNGYGPRVWTVIDAPRPDDEPRYRVYYANSEILRRFEEYPYGFRLLNLQGLPGELDEYLPAGEVLFKRKKVA